MSNKRRTAFIIVLVSVALLLVYVGVLKKQDTMLFLNVSTVEGQTEISLIEQRMDFGSKAELRGEEYTVTEVNMQQSYADGRHYLFLPDYLDLSEVYVVASGAEGSLPVVTFEDMTVGPEATVQCALEENCDYKLNIDGAEIVFQVMKGSGIPTLWVSTDESMSYIHESQSHTTGGDVKILSDKGKTEYSGTMEYLKGRGNSSWYMLKKSYTLKLDTAASLLGMTPGKSWVLQGGALDATCMRNKIFMDMAVENRLQNSMESEWVDLYINGEYYGCYLLTEKIAVASGRLEIGDLEEQMEVLNEQPLENYGPFTIEGDISMKGYGVINNPDDISGGYLLEVETYMQRYHEESSGFITMNGIPILVKSPNHVSQAQIQYISSYVQQFEEALYSEDGYNLDGKYYLDYIDLDSFALRYLIDEISKNIDAGFSSYFFYKPQGDDKMYAGPVWDFDTALGNNNNWGDSTVLQDPSGLYMNRANWSEQLWAKPDFRMAVEALYAEKLLPYLNELVDSGLDEYAATVYDSAKMEGVYMGRPDLDGEIGYLKDFIRARRDYLEEELIGE